MKKEHFAHSVFQMLSGVSRAIVYAACRQSEPYAAAMLPSAVSIRNDLNQACVKGFVSGQYWQIFEFRLGHKYAIKWVAVVDGQAASPQRMGSGDGKLQKFRALQGLSVGLDQFLSGWQLADPIFGCDFPGRGAADEDAILRIVDDGTTGGVKLRLIKDSPQQNMGIEKVTHSHSCNSSSVMGSKKASPT